MNYIHSIIIGLCLLLAGASNGVMDKLQFHYSSSVFAELPVEKQQYWNPNESWKNKYENWPTDKTAAFPLSKTALVFLTDGWHLFQFIMLSLFTVAVVISFLFPFMWHYKETNTNKIVFALIAFALAKGAFSVGFHLTYSLFLTA